MRALYAVTMLISLIPISSWAHGIDGFTRIRGAACRVKSQDAINHSIVVMFASDSEAKIYAYTGARNPINPAQGLKASGTGKIYSMAGFPTNKEEEVVIKLDKKMQDYLGRPNLVLRSKIINANDELPSPGFLSNPMGEEEDIDLSCSMNLQSTREDLDVINPEFAQKATHPSLCAIEFRDDYIVTDWTLGCTATIIGKNTLLTAAHCEESFAKVQTRVRCGENSEWKKIKSWTANPGFRPAGHEVYNPMDISVIELNSDAGGPAIKVESSVAATHEMILNNPSCTHYGFGRRQDDSIGMLYKSTYHYPSQFLDGINFVERIFEMTNMIASDPERFLRSGDSGGPIICKDKNNQDAIVGVHAFVSPPSSSALSSLTAVSWNFISEFLK